MKEREYRTCPMAIDTAIETNIYIYYYMSLTLIIINQTFKSKRTLQLLLHVLVQLTETMLLIRFYTLTFKARRPLAP